MVLAVGALASQVGILAAGSFPSANMSASQYGVQAVTSGAANVFASQTGVFVAAAGAISNPQVRVWTYTLDGHDYYVLRLGNDETLVYDCFSKTWSTWGSDDALVWKANTGCNWSGANSAALNFGSNVIVGDDANGSLYFLDPNGVTDDDAVRGSSVPHPFTRQATGQLVTHGYDAQRCYNVTLRGSIGFVDDTTLVNVDLSYSDDGGDNYISAGSLAIVPGQHDFRLQWRSLGSLGYPGRLFRITDYGGLKRLDTMDILADGNK